MHWRALTGDDDGPGDRRPTERELAEVRRWSPPENELPAPVPASAVLVRTDELGVAVVGLQAYTTGVTFQLAVRLRTTGRGRRRRELHDLLGRWPDGDPGGLLLGVEFSDGRAASTAGLWHRDGPGEHDEPLLTQTGGGGSDRTYDQGHWLTPLPPAGPLTLVLSWQAMGVQETQTVVDGGLVAAAASSAVVLWPPQPPDDDEPGEPALPTSGWFGRMSRRRG